MIQVKEVKFLLFVFSVLYGILGNAESVQFVLKNISDISLKDEPYSMKLKELGFSNLLAIKNLNVFIDGNKVPSQLDDIDGIHGFSSEDELCFRVTIPYQKKIACQILSSYEEKDGKEILKIERSENGKELQIKDSQYTLVIRRDTGQLLKFERYSNGQITEIMGDTPFGINLTTSSKDKNYCWSTYNWKADPVRTIISNGPLRCAVKVFYNITDNVLPSYTSDSNAGKTLAPISLAIDVKIQQKYFFYPDGTLDIYWEIINAGKNPLPALTPPWGWSSREMRCEIMLPTDNLSYKSSISEEKIMPDKLSSSSEAPPHAFHYDFISENGNGLGIAFWMDKLSSFDGIRRNNQGRYLFIGKTDEKNLGAGEKIKGGLRILNHDANSNAMKKLISFVLSESQVIKTINE